MNGGVSGEVMGSWDEVLGGVGEEFEVVDDFWGWEVGCFGWGGDGGEVRGCGEFEG